MKTYSTHLQGVIAAGVILVSVVTAGAQTNSGIITGPALPYGASEVVKLYQSGISKDTIVNYIDANALPYHLDANGIIYLKNLGVPDEITRDMIQRDGQLQQQVVAAQQAQQQQQQMLSSTPSATSMPSTPEPVVTPTTPAPDVTVIGSDTPYYSYPYYDYGAWPVYVGGGWGWGNRWGWGHSGFHSSWGFHGGGGFHGGTGSFHGGGGGFHGGTGGFHGGSHGGGHR